MSKLRYRPEINARAYTTPMLQERLAEIETIEACSTVACAPRTGEIRAIRRELGTRTDGYIEPGRKARRISPKLFDKIG